MWGKNTMTYVNLSLASCRNTEGRKAAGCKEIKPEMRRKAEICLTKSIMWILTWRCVKTRKCYN